ncbi:MAG: ABC transporter permease subunit [Magnetospirillum sp.]|nr:ABC transporter permease subunit [Magnetospirillum sp.]
MFDLALAWLPRFFAAAALTIGLSAAIFALSGLVGLALALAVHEAKSAAPRRALEVFSGFFRAVPELVVLFFVFFGGIQIGLDLGPIGATLVAFGLVGIAYDFQVFKGALAAVSPGQFEAGRALGFGRAKLYAFVVLPQMLPIARKGWLTYAIGTVKRVSIASAVSVSEIMYVTKQAIAATNAPFLFLSIAVALYIAVVAPLLAFNERRA